MDKQDSKENMPPLSIVRSKDQIANNVPALVVDGNDVMKKLKWGQAALFIGIAGLLLAAITAGAFIFLLYIGTSH